MSDISQLTVWQAQPHSALFTCPGRRPPLSVSALHLSLYLSLSVCLDRSIYLCIYIYIQSMSISIYLSIYLSICLSNLSISGSLLSNSVQSRHHSPLPRRRKSMVYPLNLIREHLICLPPLDHHSVHPRTFAYLQEGTQKP